MADRTFDLELFVAHFERELWIEYLWTDEGKAAYHAYKDAFKKWAAEQDAKEQRDKILHDKTMAILRDNTPLKQTPDRRPRPRLITKFRHRKGAAPDLRSALRYLRKSEAQMRGYIWRCIEWYEDGEVPDPFELDPVEEFEAFAERYAKRDDIKRDEKAMRLFTRTVAKTFQKAMKRLLIPVEIEYSKGRILFEYQGGGDISLSEVMFFHEHLGSAAKDAGGWVSVGEALGTIQVAAVYPTMTDRAFEERYRKW